MSDEERMYWMGFSAFPGIGPLRFRLLLDYFGHAKDAWCASDSQLHEIGLGESLVKRFITFRNTFDLPSFYMSLVKQEISFFTFQDPHYPHALKEISDAPFGLYVRGNIPDGPCIGIVGTRRVTSYGREITTRITSGLAESGVTIVSGLAYGVDTIAHHTALDESGKTIAVLGCGVDVIYPKSNTSLYWRIIKEGRGCVMSEFPPGTYTEKGTFPARNRIISGLSSGIVVTEGSADSGALITAKYAAQQGREVFAVPGPITSEMSAAPTILIKQGAKLVTSAKDILEELGIKRKMKNEKGKDTVLSRMTSEEMCVYEALQREALSVDDLVRETRIPASRLGSLLTVMEMKNLIVSDTEGKYRAQ